MEVGLMINNKRAGSKDTWEIKIQWSGTIGITQQ